MRRMARPAGRVTAVATTVVAAVALLGPSATAHTPASVSAKPRPTLSFGMWDPSVIALQSRLGMSLVTGYFGPITLANVKRLQESAGLPVTGVVNHRTWKALWRHRIAPEPAPVQAGTRRSPVLGTHATLGDVAAPIRRFRDGGHAYYRYNGRLHSCRYRGRCLDANAPIGAPVFAMADGKLTVAPYAAHSYGNYVTIKHRDGTESIYAHMDAVTARSGPVTAGTQIGTVGCSGTSAESNGCRSLEAHLHFEWSGLHWRQGEAGEDPPHFDLWRGNPRRCYQGC